MGPETGRFLRFSSIFKSETFIFSRRATSLIKLAEESAWLVAGLGGIEEPIDKTGEGKGGGREVDISETLELAGEGMLCFTVTISTCCALLLVQVIGWEAAVIALLLLRWGVTEATTVTGLALFWTMELAEEQLEFEFVFKDKAVVFEAVGVCRLFVDGFGF